MIYSYSQKMGIDDSADYEITTTPTNIQFDTEVFSFKAPGAMWMQNAEDEWYFDMKQTHGSPTAYRIFCNFMLRLNTRFSYLNNVKINVRIDTPCGLKTRDVMFEPLSSGVGVLVYYEPVSFYNLIFDEVFSFGFPAKLNFTVEKENDTGNASILGNMTECFIYSVNH